MIVRFPPVAASLALGGLFLCSGALTVYLCHKFFFPLLRNQTALELDKEKLQFFITGRTIYWKELKSISYDTLNNGGWAIIFAFKNGDDNVDISTKYIRGNDEEIYNSIQAYFENTGNG